MAKHRRGLIDTSVLIEMERLNQDDLPDEVAIAAATLAELAAGPHATNDSAVRAERLDRLQRVEATFNPLPFDVEAARAYGRVYAAVVTSGRKARGRRAIDLLIAATAIAADLPVYTCNPSDFESLTDILDVVPVKTVPRGATPHQRRRR